MDQTKQKILLAATDVFVRKGFSGTSISDIAKCASINQSLIYHHIGNKQLLWKEVKKNLLHNILPGMNSSLPSDNFRNFLDIIVDLRVEIYSSDPRILRLIQWQMLEDEKTHLIGSEHIVPYDWIEAIELMQRNGLIIGEYSAELIAIYIHSAINGLIFDHFQIFLNDKKKKSQFVQMLKCNILSFFEKASEIPLK